MGDWIISLFLTLISEIVIQFKYPCFKDHITFLYHTSIPDLWFLLKKLLKDSTHFPAFMKLLSPSLSLRTIECDVTNVTMTIYIRVTKSLYWDGLSGTHYKIPKSDTFRYETSESSFEPTSPPPNHYCVGSFPSNIIPHIIIFREFFILFPENQPLFWLYISDAHVTNQLYPSRQQPSVSVKNTNGAEETILYSQVIPFVFVLYFLVHFKSSSDFEPLPFSFLTFCTVLQVRI